MIHALAIALFAVQSPATENPLTPLTEIAQRLDKGMAEFLKGTDPAEAFKPWAVNAKRSPKLRDDLKAAGIASAESFGLEFELYLFSEGRCVYRLRTFLYATPKETAFIELRGEAATNAPSKARAPATYKDELAPFGKSAELVFEILKSGTGSGIPIADAEAMKKRFPASLHAKIQTDLEKTSKNIEKALAEIRDIKADEVRLAVDDQVYLALDSSGTVKGFLNCEFDFDKTFEFEIGRFEPLKE